MNFFFFLIKFKSSNLGFSNAHSHLGKLITPLTFGERLWDSFYFHNFPFLLKKKTASEKAQIHVCIQIRWKFNFFGLVCILIN